MDTMGNQTIRDVIAYQSAVGGAREYLVHEDRAGEVATLLYGELESQTNAVANYVLGLGLAPGDRVLMMLRNSIPLALTMLGCAKAGIVTAAINTEFVLPEVRHAIGLIEPKVVLVDAEFAEVVLDAAGDHPAVQFGCVLHGEADGWPDGLERFAWADVLTAPIHATDVPLAGEDVMQLVLTSGTTAHPKAVERTHTNCLWSAHRFAMQSRLTPADRNLTALPAYHVACLDQTIFSSLVSGGTAILLPRYSARSFLAQIRRHRATVVSVMPMLVRTLLAQTPSQADRDHSVRLVLGGFHLKREEFDGFQERFGIPVPMLGGYGLTEACTTVAYSVLGGDPRWPSAGLPSLDRTILLVDDDGNPVPAGDVGEIIVQGVPGRSLMKGYFRDPEATARALRDGWLHTGDLARFDDAGYLHFAGRKKEELIKVAGENVSAPEVERVLGEHPEVKEVAVIGVPHDLRDEAVKAIIVTVPGSSLDLDALRQYCEGRLARFKLPTQLETVDSLPRAALGKINKGVLVARHRTPRRLEATEQRP
jgi:carnitine-CoA ligase